MSLARPILLTVPLLMVACTGGGDMNKFGTQISGAGETAPVTTSSGGQGALGPTVTGSAPGDDDGGSDSGGPDMPGVTDFNTGEESSDKCVEISETASKQLPADIILVIDNSGSMEIEAASVKANMNKFSSKIIDSGVDVHVVLISAMEGKLGMCIEPPLGGGGCPIADSKLPTFLHIDRKVGSYNPLQKLLDHHADWKDQMRPGARKHIAVVSDDNSELSAKAFDAAFKALDPSYADYRFHAIVGKNDAMDKKWCASEPVCCDLTAAAGEVYLDLIKATDGVYGDLCEQDFTPVFDALSSAVIQNSGLACDWTIPDPPEDALIDLADVYVEFNDGMGAVLPITELATPATCADAIDGWYYDNPEQPSKLAVCPQTCTKMQLAPKGSIKIQLGCKPLTPQ